MSGRLKENDMMHNVTHNVTKVNISVHARVCIQTDWLWERKWARQKNREWVNEEERIIARQCDCREIKKFYKAPYKAKPTLPMMFSQVWRLTLLTFKRNIKIEQINTFSQAVWHSSTTVTDQQPHTPNLFELWYILVNVQIILLPFLSIKTQNDHMTTTVTTTVVKMTGGCIMDEENISRLTVHILMAACPGSNGNPWFTSCLNLVLTAH